MVQKPFNKLISIIPSSRPTHIMIFGFHKNLEILTPCQLFANDFEMLSLSDYLPTISKIMKLVGKPGLAKPNHTTVPEFFLTMNFRTSHRQVPYPWNNTQPFFCSRDCLLFIGVFQYRMQDPTECCELLFWRNH